MLSVVALALAVASSLRCPSASVARLRLVRRAVEREEDAPALRDEELTNLETTTDGSSLDMEAMRRDIERFKSLPPRVTAEEEARNAPMQTLQSGLAAVLGFNFVVVVGLFLWFLYACFNSLVLNVDKDILAVQSVFEPYILPLLTTHMALTFLSYGLERLFPPFSSTDDGARPGGTSP